MALITSPVPQVGVPVGGQEAIGIALFTEIRNLLNGSVEKDNLSVRARNLLDPPVVTVLPGSPADGDRVFYSVGDGAQWPLRYNAGSASPYKWEAVGAGIPKFSANYNGATVPGTFTWGCPLAVPLTGDYVLSSAYVSVNENDADGTVSLSLHSTNSGTPTFVDVAAQRRSTPGALLRAPEQIYTLTAGTWYMPIYRQGSGSVYGSQWAIYPRRVG